VAARLPIIGLHRAARRCRAAQGHWYDARGPYLDARARGSLPVKPSMRVESRGRFLRAKTGARSIVCARRTIKPSRSLHTRRYRPALQNGGGCVHDGVAAPSHSARGDSNPAGRLKMQWPRVGAAPTLQPGRVLISSHRCVPHNRGRTRAGQQPRPRHRSAGSPRRLQARCARMDLQDGRRGRKHGSRPAPRV
jgi:hypothetical protein